MCSVVVRQLKVFFLPEMLSLKNKIQISERENDIYVNFRLLGKNYDVLAVILSNI